MQAIIFSTGKQRFAEFHADALSFERQPEGIVVAAEGQMAFQDTALLEPHLAEARSCNVRIMEGDSSVIDECFEVTFFACEPDNLIFRMA